MQLTTDQKRRFIKLIASGKANARDFKAIPERHFTRVSPLPVQDELSLTDAGEPQVNILPGIVFKCGQSGKEYTYSQIEEMAGKENIWCSIADNPPTEPACIDELEIMPVSANERINYFLNNNY